MRVDGRHVDHPTFPCDYVDGVLVVAIEMLPSRHVSHLTIEHDPWCPMLGGAGDRPCRPDFFLDGVRVVFPEETEPEERQQR